MSRVSVVEALSQFYGSKAIYAHEIEHLKETRGIRRARVFYTVSSDHAHQRFDQPPLDEWEAEEDGPIRGILHVTSLHAVDHFKDVKVFPGHKGIRAAVAYACKTEDHFDEYRRVNERMRLLGLESVRFERPVIPNCVLRVSELEDDPTLAPRSITISNEKGVVTTITGLKVGHPNTRRLVRAALLEDQLIEAMAQAAAVTALDLNKEISNDSIPLFSGIGRARFFGYALEDVTVKMKTSTVSEGRGFRGNIEAYVGRNKIAEVEDLKAMIVPARVARKIFDIKLAE